MSNKKEECECGGEYQKCENCGDKFQCSYCGLCNCLEELGLSLHCAVCFKMIRRGDEFVCETWISAEPTDQKYCMTNSKEWCGKCFDKLPSNKKIGCERIDL